MGGQAIERREILRYISLASVAGTFPGFSRWAFACGHGGDGRPQDQVHGYRALFFSQPQFLMVERLAEMIIPADDTPSAKEAGVAEFIDFMVANKVPVSTSYDIRSTEDAIHAGNQAQEQLVSGLAWLNARSKSEFGSKFLDCSAEQQNSLLEELAYKAKYKPATESGREFFHLMRDYTVIGYYTTKIGLESLGYPGLQDTWEKMPSCSHPNDPEHAYLRDRALVNQVAFLKVSR
jgi:gluconate 2-dehydrogenase gamma chain